MEMIISAQLLIRFIGTIIRNDCHIPSRTGQVATIPNAELRPILICSPEEPELGVTSSELAAICPEARLAVRGHARSKGYWLSTISCDINISNGQSMIENTCSHYVMAHGKVFIQGPPPFFHIDGTSLHESWRHGARA